MKWLTVILIPVIVAGCLVPVMGTLGGIAAPEGAFTLTGNEQIAPVTATTAMLSDAAPVFFEYGADSCLVAHYARTGESYRAEILSFGTPTGALAAYAFRPLAESTPADLGARGRKNTTRIEFVKGYYYIAVQILSGGTPDGALDLARLFDRRIRGGRIAPSLTEALPQRDMVEGSALYFAGPQAFESRFAGMAGSLAIETGVTGTAARYSTGPLTADLVKIKFADREKTLAALDTFLKAQAGKPVLRSSAQLEYFTVVGSDRRETYIAERANVLYVMLDGHRDYGAQELFEYIVRGGR